MSEGRRHAASAGAFALLALVVTWPLARNMGRSVADPGDPYVNIWILDWVHWALLHQPFSLFDSNTFYPATDSLAFSENLFGIALLLVPLRLLGMGPITAYNVAMLAGFAFSGFAAYLLGWRLTRSYAGALAGGVFYAFGPFRITHIPHLQHVWGGWLVLLPLALLVYLDRPSWRSGALFGLVFLMNGLTNIHWLFFGTVAVGITAAGFAVAGHRRWRELLACSAVASGLLLPFLLPYWRLSRRYGLARSWEETRGYSASLRDWFVANPDLQVYRRLADASVDPERWLFPGLLALGLSFVAVVAFRRNKRAVALGLTWLIVGVVGSLGLNGLFHTFLYEFVPGFQGIRAPARWAGVAYVGLAALIAVSVALFEHRASWAALLVPLALVFELRAWPVRWYMTDPEPPVVNKWLATQPLEGGVLELPLDWAGSEYVYLLRATAHHKPLLNGVSGPPDLVKLRRFWNGDSLGDDFTAQLRRMRCELLIVHADAMDRWDEPMRAWLKRELQRGTVQFVGRFDGGLSGDWVFALQPRPRLNTPQSVLDDYLAGRRTANGSLFGHFDPPELELRGQAAFTGFAFSPDGIRSVDLLFEQGSVRIPAQLVEDWRLSQRFPFYAATPRPRFVYRAVERPAGVSVRTDVQAEVVDHRGRRRRFGSFWIEWR